MFNTAAEARDHVLGRPLGMVIKAEGLAGGKGVYVCDNLRQALDAIDQIMVRRVYGKAGDRIILEERLDGQETSILAFTDGRTIIPLESSQDHKRAFDHDEGPNTGGMGAYSPTAIVTPELMDQVEREILVPIVHALKRARRPFRGVIYAGLMLTNQGPKVLEFNVRLRRSRVPGRPDAAQDRPVRGAQRRGRRTARPGQPGMGPAARRHRRHGVGGIPRPLRARPGDQQPRAGGTAAEREGLPRRHDPPGRPQSGRDGRIVTDGGRVLDVTALGATLAEAQARAYEAVHAIRYTGAWYRRDIAEQRDPRQGLRTDSESSPDHVRPARARHFLKNGDCGRIEPSPWSLRQESR